MSSDTFNALVLEESDGRVTSSVRQIDESQLPEGDVTVRVDCSTLNYKDGMILNGIGRLVRRYPHVPGIDFAGTVEESSSDRYKPGDKVILTGWRVGETHWGGYAQKARVRSDWLVPMPEGMSPRQAMAVGTAGFTAMLALMALEEHGLEPDGEVLVTGASGGVGSIAVAVLAKNGHNVVASTGREESHDYLKELGAADILHRDELSRGPARPLESERWAGAIDAVGGATLATVIAGLRHAASVAAVGLAGGAELHTSVLPFLLRGVNLLGIDSVMCPFARRQAAWGRLAKELPSEALERMTSVVPLGELPDLGGRILKGEVRGRVVVDVNA